jgi:hypothetical protein
MLALGNHDAMAAQARRRRDSCHKPPSAPRNGRLDPAAACTAPVLLLMRFPSIPTLIRSLHAFTNSTSRVAHPSRGRYSSPRRASLVRAMPNVPFLGALFGTKMADNTTYPVQKAEGEWQAQLSPGTSRSYAPAGPHCTCGQRAHG